MKKENKELEEENKKDKIEEKESLEELKEEKEDENKQKTKKALEITEEKLEKIKDEIDNNKRKTKKTVKDTKLSKDIFRNVLIAVIISIYFLFIALGVKTIPITEYLLDLKTFAIFTVIIAIVIFEKAYKKDENYLAIHGLEMVVLGIETLVILNLYSLENNYFEYVLYGITGGMFAYYIIKCIVILIKSKIKKNKS